MWSRQVWESASVCKLLDHADEYEVRKLNLVYVLKPFNAGKLYAKFLSMHRFRKDCYCNFKEILKQFTPAHLCCIFEKTVLLKYLCISFFSAAKCKVCWCSANPKGLVTSTQFFQALSKHARAPHLSPQDSVVLNPSHMFFCSTGSEVLDDFFLLRCIFLLLFFMRFVESSPFWMGIRNSDFTRNEIKCWGWWLGQRSGMKNCKMEKTLCSSMWVAWEQIIFDFHKLLKAISKLQGVCHISTYGTFSGRCEPDMIWLLLWHDM